jgi:hypothetical protein
MTTDIVRPRPQAADQLVRLSGDSQCAVRIQANRLIGYRADGAVGFIRTSRIGFPLRFRSANEPKNFASNATHAETF